jgi:hypothetical protein
VALLKVTHTITHHHRYTWLMMTMALVQVVLRLVIALVVGAARTLAGCFTSRALSVATLCTSLFPRAALQPAWALAQFWQELNASLLP